MMTKNNETFDTLDYPKGDLFHNNFSKENPLRILLLEDSESDAELIAYYLGDITTPYTLKHVLNKNDFHRELTAFNPHFVISDFQLPQYTGRDALIHVRKLSEYLPFIICTGRINEETAVECIKLGADDYVIKDDLKRLPSAVNLALEAKRTKVQKDQLYDDLKKSEENLRAITKNSPTNIYIIDKEGKILYMTNSRSPEVAVIGESLYEHVHEKNHERIKANINQSFRNRKDVEFEIEGTAESDGYNWYLCKMGPILKDGIVEQLVFMPYKITELRVAHLELNSLNTRLNQLNNHLENVRDEEKKKIAMEIHDQLGQELTGVKLGLYWIKQNLTGDLNLKKDDFENKLDDLVDLSTQVIGTTRRIAHELRPVVLDDIGLLAALEWHIENYNKFRDSKCKLEVETDNDVFEKETSTAIYRIVQESLTNIDKHAQASNALVQLIRTEDIVTLRISDDGIGINPELALKSKSMGLFGMQERVKHLNGTLQVNNLIKGTEILITLPLL